MTITSLQTFGRDRTNWGLGSLVSPRLTAHEYARESLRSGILTGSLPGGTRLVQKEVARRLEVSTTPVREALRDLVSEGLVHLDPHRGAVVTGLDDAELTEIYEILRLVEPAVVNRAAANVTGEQVEVAERLQANLDASADPTEWAKLEAGFHGWLCSLSRSPRLEAFTQSTRDVAHRYLVRAVVAHPGCLNARNEEHRQLIAALAARRPQAAVQVARKHLKGIRTCVLAEKHDPPVDVAT